ncbi:MAG TPA: fimbria/pilus outer membrane usher protein [Alphaproteobacteria bacterium]|nr:fimbria/pilus outer membrane usher protein [Alphaproteobacteria bacterium]
MGEVAGRWDARRWAALGVALMLLGLSTRLWAAEAGFQRALLQLLVNGVDRGVAVSWIRGKDIFVGEEDLRRAGLPLTGGERETIEGKPYVRLGSLAPTVTYVYDEAELALRFKVEPRLLAPTTLDLSREKPKDLVYLSSPSAFLNYAVTTQQFGEPSLFGEQGVSIDGAFFDNSLTRDPTTGRTSRINTSLSIDDRNDLTRLQLGDAPADGGNLGGLTQIGGVSYFKNFAIDPYFTPFPGQSFSGIVNTPSVADVYVNGLLVRSINLPPGPFNLENLPVNVGSGNTRIVIRNALGQQQVIGGPYYLSTQLLQEGLNQFNYNLGYVRTSNIGITGGYERPAVIAHHRYGWSDAVTPGAFFESDRRVYAGGPEVTLGLPLGQLQLLAAGSRDEDLAGWAGSANYSYITPDFTVGGDVTSNSRHYTTLSLPDFVDRALLRFDSFRSFPVGPAGVIAQLTRADFRDAGPSDQASLSATFRTSDRTNLSLSLSRTTQKHTPVDNSVFLALNIILDPTTVGTVSVGKSSGQGATGTVQVQKSLPIGEGFGYLAQAQAGSQAMQRADVQYQGAYGRYEFDYSHFRGVDTSTASVSGAVVAIGGDVLPTRPINDAYALIRVPGVANVTGYLANQPVGRTDGDGDLLVPDLLSYYGNQLSINDQDIPIDYAIGGTERTIAPPYRGGAVVAFPVHPLRAVTGTLRIAAEGETIVPAYGEIDVTLEGETASSPIGKNGEFYLEGVPAGSHAAVIKYKDRECRFDLVTPKSAQRVTALGEIRCAMP